MKAKREKHKQAAAKTRKRKEKEAQKQTRKETTGDEGNSTAPKEPLATGQAARVSSASPPKKKRKVVDEDESAQHKISSTVNVGGVVAGIIGGIAGVALIFYLITWYMVSPACPRDNILHDHS